MNVYQNQIIDLTDVGLVKINETEQQSVVRYGDILLTLSSERRKKLEWVQCIWEKLILCI